MIQWRQIEVFIAVVEKGSMAKAAEFLDISATAVGKWIQSLDSASQEPLFNRSTKKLVLTCFGQEYYQTCKAVQKSMEQANLLIHSRNRVLKGTLKLHSPSFLANVVVIPVIAQFKQKHPELDITLTVGDSIPNLLNDDYDILIGYDLHGLSSQPDLRACHLDKVRNIMAASNEYLNHFGEPKCLEDLTDHQFIHHNLLSRPLKITTTEGKEISGLQTALALGDQRLMCTAALQGLGIVYTGSRMLFPDLSRRRLREVLPKINFGETTIAAFYKHTPQEQPKVKKFLDELKHHYKHNMPSTNRCISLLEKIDKFLKKK